MRCPTSPAGCAALLSLMSCTALACASIHCCCLSSRPACTAVLSHAELHCSGVCIHPLLLPPEQVQPLSCTALACSSIPLVRRARLWRWGAPTLRRPRSGTPSWTPPATRWGCGPKGLGALQGCRAAVGRQCGSAAGGAGAERCRCIKPPVLAGRALVSCSLQSSLKQFVAAHLLAVVCAQHDWRRQPGRHRRAHHLRPQGAH